MSAIPNVSTKYSLLTRVSEDDMSILREIFDDVETRRFLPELYELLDVPTGLQKFDSTFELYAQNGEGYLWGIKHNYELVGFVAVMDLSYIPTLFYAAHPKYRSHGYMKDALQSVLGYLSNQKVARTISTDVYKENNKSINILQQLGFCVCREDDKKVYMSKTLQMIMDVTVRLYDLNKFLEERYRYKIEGTW